MEKFLKVMFGDESRAGSEPFKFKIGEENIASDWNPENKENVGGFSISVENQIARWLVRGDTLYDVILPENTEIIKINNPSTPDGVFKVNKLILINPRIVTDELALELYRKAEFPEKTYYKTLAGYAVRGYINAAKTIIKEKVNKENIDLVISEVNDFYTPKSKNKPIELSKTCAKILEILMNMKEKYSNEE